MQCPQCTGVRLVMADRQGIEVDHWPECRGVWLDRGEFDKLIERSAAGRGPEPRPPAPDERSGMAHGRKRRGMLGELFDFD